MRKLLKRLIKLFHKRQAKRETALPIGSAEFDKWAEDIIQLYDMPNNDSTKFTLATMIVHLPATVSHRSKAFFGASLHKAAANEVSFSKIGEIKERHNKQAEATAKAEASNATEQQQTGT